MDKTKVNKDGSKELVLTEKEKTDQAIALEYMLKTVRDSKASALLNTFYQVADDLEDALLEDDGMFRYTRRAIRKLFDAVEG